MTDEPVDVTVDVANIRHGRIVHPRRVEVLA